MKRSTVTILSIAASLLISSDLYSQEIRNDPNALPTMIGGRNSPNSRVDTITVAGRVILDSSGDRPGMVVSVVVYSSGRLVTRQRVAENGSYSINEVPRDGATVNVEIDQIEVATRQIMTTPGRVVYQDFNISLPQIEAARSGTKVIKASDFYDRGKDNKERYERALDQLRKGKTDSSIELLKLILKSDPKDYQAFIQLGNAYFINKDSKNAEAAYLNALQLLPGSALAMINLGKLYMSENNFEKAVEVLSKAVSTEPTSPAAQRYLGEAYLGLKKGSIAVGYLNEALRLAPNEMADVHLRLAALYNGAGLKPRAAAEYKMFLEKMPDYERRDELKKYIAENLPK